METEKASHEAEVKLIPAPPNPPHRTGEQITELQNGNRSPKLLHQQVNGDPPWNHCTANAEVNQMKRHQNNSPFSAEMQEMFGYSPDIGIKHVFSEPPLLGHYQPKRIRVDMENNDQEDKMMIFQDKEKSLSTESKLDCFPDFSKITEFECNVFQEDKLGKKNCVWSHRDIFTLSRNKQTVVLNGATVTSETTEGTRDDLTEKTGSTYYPCVPTASQKVKSPQNAAAVSLTENGIPGKQATHSASLTSGVPISPQISAADQQNRICSNTGSYSGHTAPLAVDLQQQQPRQLCPLNGVHAAARPHSLVPGMDLPPSGGRHSAKDFSNYLNASNAFEEFSQRSSPGAKLQTVEPEKFPPYTGTPTARMKGNVQLQSGNHPQGLNNHQISQEGQHQVQYGTQEQPDNLCEPDSHGRQIPFSSDLPNQLSPQKPPEDEQNSTCDREPQMNSTESQAQGNGMQWNISLKVEAEETFQPQDPYPRMNWIDPKCSPSPQKWKGFASHPQQEQQEMIQGSVHSSNPLKGFQSKGFKQSDCQQPEKLKSDQVHNRTRQQGPVPEWQPSNAKPPTSLHAQMQQVMSPQYGLPQEQGNSIFHTQIKQDSCENIQEDLDEILNSNFLLQQPPLPCLPNEYQDDNLPLKHPSQCALGGKLSQPPSQQPLDSQILNRQKLNAFISQDKQLNIQRQMVSNPTAISAPGFLNSPLPDTQPQHNVMSPYSNANGATIPDDYRLEKTIAVQQQPKYSPGPLDQRQYLQQHQNQQQSNRVDFQQPPPPLTSKQQQPQSPQVAPNPMYSKAEWPDSCSQARGGQFPSQNHRDVQRHAALRMHLLQRQGHQQNLSDFQYLLQSIKKEKGPKFELPMQQSDREQVGPSMQALVKQEQPWAPCERSQQKSIIATMENQLKRYQLSPLFEKKSLDMKSPNKIKVEMSGPVTILSTHADLGDGAFGPLEQNKTLSDFKNTKRMEPTLNSFLESPLKLFNTPIKNLLDTPVKTQYEFSSCHCVEQVSEKDEGPYYTHLGAAPNIVGIRGIMEKRYGQAGSSIRIEKVVYTGKEGKSAQGCPIAKWVIRRANVDEKVLVLVRERAGHTCETATIVVAIMIWEGISTSLADRLYTELSDTLQRHGALTNRRCALNEERTCACQGLEPETCGASFSFGCSWSMYYNGCKFARSKIPRKFKLLGDDPKEEEKVEQHLQNLATVLAPTYKQMAPDAYANQVEHENRAIDCRLGKKEGRPFSGVTACLDFCAHAHRDLHNMQGGSTVVCTLTREDNREIGKIPEDEQLHVLPLYKVSQTDEFGSAEGQRAKIESGAIQVLSAFRRKVRMLSEPAKSCRQRKLESKRGGANKSSNPDTPNSKAEKALPAKPKSCCNENTGQSTLVSGPPPGYGQLGAPLSGNQQLSLGAQQKQQQQQQQQQPHSLPNPHPSSSNQTQPRFPNRADRFPSTSQPNMFPPSPAMVSPYPSQMHTTNSHLNGSNPANSHPGSLTTGNYPGYQCNGGIPKDNHSAYYVSNPKHLDMFQPPRRQLYPQHQYSALRHFGVSYPTPYGEHGAQVNGYSKCNTRPNVPTLGPHSLDPNSRLDPEYLEAISRTPSTQLNYAALSKNAQHGAHANPCLAQGSPTFPPGLDSVCMQKIPEVNLQGMNGMVQVNPALGSECSTAMPLVCGFQNGDIHGTPLKQEPGVQTSGKKEEVWSDNEHNFLDPEIGGVALAPSHGSILIECAKRELHATTPLKNPERNHPTRISLVFYQHKSMNEAKHGLALWEAKMAEKAREKEEDPEKHGTGGTPGKSKKVKREDSEASRRVESAYKHFVKPFTQSSISCTTNTYVSTAPYAFTRVTGPYNCYM